MVPNPAYKGPWKPKVLLCQIFSNIKSFTDYILQVLIIKSLVQKIKNPNYKGKWKIPWIDNPGGYSFFFSFNFKRMKEQLLSFFYQQKNSCFLNQGDVFFASTFQFFFIFFFVSLNVGLSSMKEGRLCFCTLTISTYFLSHTS